ncbi:MAG: hypothetical protein ACW98K_02570 [Candidatus Kariarchaeaceae archaeon]|jgi:hypothetical protein
MKILKLTLILSLLLFATISFHSVHYAAAKDGDEETTEETNETHEETESENHTDDHTDEEEEKSLEKVLKRRLDVDIEDDKIEIKSELESGDNKDKFEVEFDVGSSDEAEFDLRYYTETSAAETKLRYRVKFEGIIEFRENVTGNSTQFDGYQKGEEVSFYEIGKTGWNDLAYSLNSAGMYTITAKTSDNVFTLTMFIAESVVHLENNSFTPNSVKIDIGITNFPYSENNTSLAIQTQVKSEAEQSIRSETEDEENDFAEEESEIRLKSSNAEGYFSWVEYANADSLQVPVLASSLADSTDDEDLEPGESSSRIYFSFAVSDANDIVWDPKIGVTSQGALALLSADGTDASLPGFELVLIISSLLLVLAPASYKRRDK